METETCCFCDEVTWELRGPSGLEVGSPLPLGLGAHSHPQFLNLWNRLPENPFRELEPLEQRELPWSAL